METLITGIHHVTAVSGNAQENINFYTGILGLRLVKKTVNFDDPNAYHFYFGDEAGRPGTIMTTFPYGNSLQMGRHGKGKINTTAFSLPSNSLDYWQRRLKKYHIAVKHPQQRFGNEVFVYLEDYDGLGIELVFSEKEKREGYSFNKNIPEEHSIRGIHHVEMWVEAFEKTGALLTTVLNHQLVSEASNRFRYTVKGQHSQYIDVLYAPDALRGFSGRGMVHHVAFATANTESQLQLMEKIKAFGLHTTGIRNRNYFTSIYFTEPGGVIFEIATSGPGFTIDEDIAELGMALKLPAQFEEKREALNKSLPVFHYPTQNFT